ncbi:MAG: hypothetical protein ABW360_14990 [Phenylobacterium sp.]
MSTPYRVGGEILVNVNTAGDQTSPELVTFSPVTLADGGGRMAAVWADNGSGRIMARFFGEDGQPEAGEVILADQAGAARLSATAVDFYGFAVAWGGSAVVTLGFFNPYGAAVGVTQTIATGIGSAMSGSLVSGWDLGSHGGVVEAAVEFHRYNFPQGTSSNETHVALYGASGTSTQLTGGPNMTDAVVVGDSVTGLISEVGTGVSVASWTFGATYTGVSSPGVGNSPAAAAAPGGGLAIAWEAGNNIWLKGPTGPAVQVNTGSTGLDAEVVVMADGRIVVGWTAPGADPNESDVKARVFNADGTASSDVFTLSTITAGHQSDLSLTAGPYGGFSAAWIDDSGQSVGGGPADASGQAVKMQTFEVFDSVQTGSALVDHLAGTSGADRLEGGAGADWLDGGRGWDVLVGGSGGDLFALAANGSVDRVMDFNRADGDFLVVFDAQGAVAPGAGALLIYNPASGTLAWDADGGSGAGLPVTIGVLDGADVTLDRGAFAAGFQPAALRTLLPGGGRQDVAFDWSGQTFDTATTTYRANGELEVYDVRYDNGARSVRTNDLDGLHSDWATVVLETNPQGQVSAYSVFHDDGSRTLWLFDVANTMFYSRVVEEYDPLGRLSQQAAASDDGTAYERHFDTYDTQPWAYYHDTYRADGLRLSHTFYNADGSVYVG